MSRLIVPMSSSSVDYADAPPVEVAPPLPENSPIVVVDDDPSMRALIGKYLSRDGYPVEEFQDARDALDALSRESTALLISEMVMPGMSGIDLARRALEEDPDLAIIILTGAADAPTAAESLRLGLADYLTKPIDIGGLEESVQRALRRRAQAIYRRKLQEWLRGEVASHTEEMRCQKAELEQLTLAALSALIRAMEAKGPYLKGHSERVGNLCEEMARRLGMGPKGVKEVRVAGLLHDIGMIRIPDSILNKPAALTPQEYQQIKEHVTIGAEILRPLTYLGRSLEYVRHHHERLDGSGYPDGLKGNDTPLGARILALAESYVSLSEERPFRPALSPLEALETLGATEGMWYERRLLDALELAVNEEESLAPAPGLPILPDALTSRVPQTSI